MKLSSIKDFEIISFERPMPYREIWKMQKDLFQYGIESKRSLNNNFRETIIVLQHQPVITLGRHGNPENLIASGRLLEDLGIECISIERGGDITYHGPGQLVVYPIIDLEKHHLGVKRYVEILEEAVIRTIGEFGITGERVEGATGVWIGKGSNHERKICALGIKCSRFVTMHGLALNVNTDLDAFTLINPCGFKDKDVTSISRELGYEIDIKNVAEIILKHLASLL